MDATYLKLTWKLWKILSCLGQPKTKNQMSHFGIKSRWSPYIWLNKYYSAMINKSKLRVQQNPSIQKSSTFIFSTRCPQMTNWKSTKKWTFFHNKWSVKLQIIAPHDFQLLISNKKGNGKQKPKNNRKFSANPQNICHFCLPFMLAIFTNIKLKYN